MLSAGSCGLDELPWASLRYRHTSGLRALLVEQQRAPATVNRFVAALRGAVREAWRLRQMTAEDYQQAADIPLVTGSRLPSGRRLAGDEIQALFACCANDMSAAGVRDAAILAVLVGCGLRRSEAAGLDLSDYQRVTSEIRVRVAKGREGTDRLCARRYRRCTRRLAGRPRCESRTALCPCAKGRAPRTPRHDRPGDLCGARAAARGGGWAPLFPARSPENLHHEFARRRGRPCNRPATRRPCVPHDDGALRPSWRGRQAKGCSDAGRPL